MSQSLRVMVSTSTIGTGLSGTTLCFWSLGIEGRALKFGNNVLAVRCIDDCLVPCSR
jgi:hypothetical protein